MFAERRKNKLLKANGVCECVYVCVRVSVSECASMPECV